MLIISLNLWKPFHTSHVPVLYRSIFACSLRSCVGVVGRWEYLPFTQTQNTHVIAATPQPRSDFNSLVLLCYLMRVTRSFLPHGAYFRASTCQCRMMRRSLGGNSRFFVYSHHLHDFLCRPPIFPKSVEHGTLLPSTSFKMVSVAFLASDYSFSPPGSANTAIHHD